MKTSKKPPVSRKPLGEAAPTSVQLEAAIGRADTARAAAKEAKVALKKAKKDCKAACKTAKEARHEVKSLKKAIDKAAKKAGCGKKSFTAQVS